MPEHTLIFRDIAMVFAAALVAALAMYRLRQPIILGYVLAGLILSPLTPGPRIHDVQTFETMAEIGVILLMFSVGLEFSIPDLLRVKWVALVGAPLGILVSIALGVGVGYLAGWPFVQGVAIGCIISVASTMVLMRLLIDRGQLSSTTGRVMIAITLVEDLAVVILTVLLPSLTSTQLSVFTTIGLDLAKALLILIPVMFLGRKFIPRLLARIERTSNDELSLLVALTICLVVAALTEAIGLSLALGAFLGGLLIGTSDFAHKIAGRTLPLRDAFVALFFVTIGMLIDPSTWLRNWKLLAILVAMILAGKFLIWTGVVRLFRYPWKSALHVGIGLTQIGEFSFILAQVALRSHLITTDVYNATLAASLVTILCNATLFRIFNPPVPTAQSAARAS